MVLTLPLDLETLLVANFAGSAEIFLFIAVIFLAGLAAKFRMPNGIALPMLGLFAVFMMGTTLAGTFTGVYFIVLILSAFFAYYGITKFFQ